MNKKTACPCDLDCKCNPCECNDSSTSCCKPENHHSGGRFWFWTTIRILLVVFIIVGAFFLGVRMGFGEFTARLGMDSYGRGGYYGSMMHHRMPRTMPNMNECQQYLRQLNQTGTILPSTQSGQSRE